MDPLPSAQVSISWELAQGVGLAGATCCLALCAIAVRPRQSAPALVLAVRRHEIIGLLALGAVAIHVIALLIVDPRVVEHLKVTAPLYEWAGLVALLALVALTLPAIEAVRRRLWSSHRRFQALHVGFACVLVPSTVAHIAATDRYVHGRARHVALLVVAIAILIALLRARARPEAAARPPGIAAAMAFGRNSRLIIGVVSLATLVLFALFLHDASRRLREPLFRRIVQLPLHFPHGKHTAVNCLACHHNYTDGRGFDTCVGCHRSRRTDLKVGAEARFHDFCLACHRNPPPPLRRHGPVTGCSTCHAASAA